MKRICFVDFDMSITGGVEAVTSSLTNALVDQYEIFVCAILQTKDKIAYDLDERIHYTKMLTCENRLHIMKKECRKKFIEYVKSNKIDIVVMMGNYPAFIVSGTRFSTKAKYIYCDHGGLMNQWHQKDITFIRFYDAIMSHKVITLTDKTRQDYIDRFHLRSGKVQRIYNWIDDKVLEEKKEYNQRSTHILTVGRCGKEKGYDMLVEIAKRVMPQHPSWEWHIYGEGEVFEEVKESIKEANLENQLILKGNLIDAYQVYHQYSFLVMTSYREGLPIVLLEADALGIPMISFDIETGPNEIIQDGFNGYLVKPFEIDEMTLKINEMIENVEKRKELSNNTTETLGKFKKENILEQWQKLFEGLVK